ncbi:MAG: 3-phosphoshikimate 1-carboxyvinyltransferase [Simkaniaceae bacterium]
MKKSSLAGTVTVPPSKSHTLRAILFGLMGKGKTVIHQYLQSPDTVAMIEAARCFGAEIEMHPDRVEIIGVGGKLPRAENVIDSGNSGQVLRFIGALAALSDGYTILTGDHSIRHNRPVKPLLEALKELGAFAASARLDGYAPIIIKGPMIPGKACLEGMDSQPVSGLLIAASFAKGQIDLEVLNPGEKPWIDLTLHWLDKFGVSYTNEDYRRYSIQGGLAYEGFAYTVPGDFSSAAYPIAAALITNSEIRINNLDMKDVQGDKKLIYALQKMGAKIEIEENSIIVKKDSHLKGMEIHINDFIDAVTILAVVGCYAEGTTVISGAEIARKKESDRIHAIAAELKKMGAQIEEKADGLIVKKSMLQPAKVRTYKDHRLVLSLAVAAMGIDGASTILNIEPVAKTYSTFYKDFRKLGANIEVVQ